ncbi:MAG: hypothetical protein WD036_08865 [Bauldia sp.]
MERLYKMNRIALRDLHSVYEAMFIRAVTSFEVFLQDQFTATMNGKVTYKKTRGVAVRMTASSSTALTDILLQKRPYLTWLPYDNTHQRALIYLKEGKPFSDVASPERDTMQRITLIRNAIAHQSTHAIQQFEDKVLFGLALLPQERRPAGFLRSVLRTAPLQRRFEFYATELGRIATMIT